ncbi:hypothetical protein [Hyalangium minutum]|uniref:Uncharacterized protein n=1 Tax=Hyalangium minutum TaxID=394096 RepID=A0A085WCG5_9BACT|nr:hypothetical protein [Hyalangium minutum]KFE65378.1 hypothetical protein DB31_1494 [Hyalangium minutum]
MSHLTATGAPGLVSPLPQRESRLTLALNGLLSWVKGRRLLGTRPPESEGSELRTLRAKPLMAAAWYGSLGPGPMCLPGQPAMSFDPGYRD